MVYRLDGRFWSKVEKLPDAPGCWLWTAALHSAGYGVINMRGLVLYAHRLSYTDRHGLDYYSPDHIHHRCHVRSCVNPNHLESMSFYQHIGLHGGEAMTATHCRRGHSMEDAYVRPDTEARQCRTCRRLAWDAFARRRSALVAS